MKVLFFLSLTLFSFQVTAATVKVTSFYFLRNVLYMAELCGKVDGAEPGISHISIKVDPRTNRPGSYNTIADENGRFCMIINTMSGEAELQLIGHTASAKAKIN